VNWRVKAVVQGALARTPGGAKVNGMLQRTLGARRDLGKYVHTKVVEDWLVHMAHLRELGVRLGGRTLVEIGTGWLPVLPLCFSLAGLGRCRTLDLNRHLSPGVLPRTVLELRRHLPAIAQAAGEPGELVRRRYDRLVALPDGEELLRAAGVEYVAPGDATRTGLPDASVDLVLSNSVLEHVPTDALHGIMVETRRILKGDGVALHSVNCEDHYAHFDRSVSPIHYLRFSRSRWRLWNNAILYQNRLRPRDFLAAAQRAGLRVVLDRHRARPELLARLAELPIDESFRDYPPEELCCTSIDFAVATGETEKARASRAS
jgi:SAM-dependent methyltransferase